MSHIIKKLSNGKYGIYSTIVEKFILSNATKEEVIEFECNESIINTKERLKKIFGRLQNKEDLECKNPTPYSRFPES